MAALPFRIKAFADYESPHAMVEQRNYFAYLDELNQLKARTASEEQIHRAMLKVARAGAVINHHRDADRIYREIWQARSNSVAAYDEIFIASVIGLAGLRRDTGSLESCIACYSVALEYDKKHLPARDIRITREKTNLAVAYLIAAKTSPGELKKNRYRRAAAGLLTEVIAEHKVTHPQGSLLEANAHQDLAYVLKDLTDRRGYEIEMKTARTMQHKLASKRLCIEP